ncbi:site-specific integrase [Solitalea sp. MAHUQ-68]|uniref:Site-specific integrase n=1 Tax=Solitalea agri TaxID=2953739 RepID=A0A9X2EZI9_9SPHI|nr:site-specific integrase [Solitalea agri]MCO4291360.1 site-specific integrase [Solitalea agri]
MSVLFTPPVLKIKRTLKERWYVEYKLKDELTSKWVQRKEYGNINRLKTREERKLEGETVRLQLQSDLENGLISLSAVTSSVKAKRNSNLTISAAIDEFLTPHLKAKLDNEKKTGVKNNNSTYNTYKRYLSYFTEYCEAYGLVDEPLNSFEQRNINIDLLEWIRFNKDWKEQSKKNFFIKVKLLFRYFYQKGFIKNDISNFRLKFIVDIEGNEPFTDEDLDKIIPNMRGSDPYLLLYCQFIYYLFLRPFEVIKLKVGMFDLNKNELHLSPEVQKVKKKAILHVPDQLVQSLKKLNLNQYDPNMYLFSKKGQPSHVSVTRGLFYYRLEKVLKEFKLEGQNKGLYSFKHTGVIHLWNHMGDNYPNRMNIIRNLCRHSSFSTTMEYLKKLRLSEDEMKVERRTL